MSELAFASATTLAAKILNKDISAVELLNYFLARKDALNSELNAIVVDTREQALADARRADADLAKGHVQGPLHGVPMTVKESFHLSVCRSVGLSVCRSVGRRTRSVSFVGQSVLLLWR